ncbi:MAG: beta-glucosidase [Bacteroidetes Order II. Incertae sedis bacterium]|nr:beta-glucosidase [Bacteroidetes Order II. bacterium]
MMYPKGFVWGCATSAYQIEGAAEEDGKGLSIWDTFSRMPGNVWQNQNGDRACDHYHRWQEDLNLIHSLGFQSYRFSLAWSRILPDGTGSVNEKGLDFYRRLTDGLLERGLIPNITLYHWDLPQALGERGGWVHPDSADWFVEYAGVVFNALGDRVPLWTTLNEPWVTAHEGYLMGNHAPGHRNKYETAKVVQNLLRASGKAIQLYKTIGHQQIGLVVNLEPKKPARSEKADVEVAALMDAYMNQQYLDPVYFGTFPEAVKAFYGAAWKEPTAEDWAWIYTQPDFLGINFYAQGLTAADPSDPLFGAQKVLQPRHTYTEMGWEVYAPALRELLVWVSERYGQPPIWITENGAAFYDPPVAFTDVVEDPLRVAYFSQHLQALQEAIRAGANVRGYYAWSLLDNFEWGYGYSKRFGIVHVDFETQKRTPKSSARFLQDHILRHTKG